MVIIDLATIRDRTTVIGHIHRRHLDVIIMTTIEIIDMIIEIVDIETIEIQGDMGVDIKP